jgi:CRP-like cAMP-binding protein
MDLLRNVRHFDLELSATAAVRERAVKTFDWVGLFRNHPVLSGLDDPHVACLLSDDASAERSYAPGEVIVREGESGDSFFLIGAGSVDVTLSGTGGQTIAPRHPAARRDVRGDGPVRESAPLRDRAGA